MRELAIALRRLAAHRSFTVTAVATLAVGIGATTAIFSTVNATLLRPLPYSRSDDVYTLNTRLVDGRWSSGRVASAYVAAIAESAPSVDRVVAVSGGEDVIHTPDRDNHQVLVQGVSEGFFEMFDLPMTEGRAFAVGDYEGPAAIVSHRVWTEVLGGRTDAIGQSIQLLGRPVPVIGVASPEMDVPPGTDIWTTIRLPPGGLGHNFQGYLRVRPGTAPEVLESELAAVMVGLSEQYPQTAGGRGFVVRPLVDAIVGDLGPILLVVLGGAGVLLLIGSVNVATLVLGRGAARAKEVAVRAALGADRGSILRGFLLESSVLAAAGTTTGLLLAWIGVRVLQAFGAAALPRLDSIPFDLRVLGFAGAMLVVTTLLTGLVPALRLTNPDIRGLLNESGRSNTTTRGTHRLLSGLLVAEVAFAIVLVSGSGWLVRSYMNLTRVDPGFEIDGRLVFTALLFNTQWAPSPVIITGPDGRQMLDPNQPPGETPMSWLDAVTERLLASGQVEAVGSASVLPLARDGDAAFYVAIPGEAYDPERQETARRRAVSPTFFEAMGTRLLAGRPFTNQDIYGPPVAIVNESFVRRYLGGRDPLSTTFAWGFPAVNFNAPVTIVGVVEDVRYGALRDPADPTMYAPSVSPRQGVVVSSTLADAAPLVRAIRAEIAAVDPSIPVTVTPLRDIVSAHVVRHRSGLGLMVLFALLSLALAAVGIYGVVAHVTDRRAGEIATRVAFGAEPHQIRGLLMRQGWSLAAMGVVIGVGAVYLGGDAAASRLYQVRALDPIVLVTAVAVVAAVTLLAFLLPAIGAARRTPTDGLSPD